MNGKAAKLFPLSSAPGKLGGLGGRETETAFFVN
jgi:hypothetical protein